MTRLVDITGRRYGRLVAVRRVSEAVGYGALWLCECDCGKTHKARQEGLIRGSTRSCGCIRVEKLLAFSAQRLKLQAGASPPSALDDLERAWTSL